MSNIGNAQDKPVARRLIVLKVLAYYGAIAFALALGQWLHITPTVGSIVIFVAILAPFVAGRLSVIEYGSLKLQLRELKQDVVETRVKVTEQVSGVRQELNNKLLEVQIQAQAYLNTGPLLAADAVVHEMRKTINITDDEVASGLLALNADLRVPAYVQLQTRPNPEFLGALTDCYILEQYFSNTVGDTRPLWQLIVATQRCCEKIVGADGPSSVLRIAEHMQHCLDFLNMSADLDRGGQCKRRLALVVDSLRRDAQR